MPTCLGHKPLLARLSFGDFSLFCFSQGRQSHALLLTARPCSNSAWIADNPPCTKAASAMPFSTDLLLASLPAEPYPVKTATRSRPRCAHPASLISLLLPGFFNLAPLLLPVRGQRLFISQATASPSTSAVLTRILNKQKTYRHLPRDAAAMTLFLYLSSYCSHTRV